MRARARPSRAERRGRGRRRARPARSRARCRRAPRARRARSSRATPFGPRSGSQRAHAPDERGADHERATAVQRERLLARVEDRAERHVHEIGKRVRQQQRARGLRGRLGHGAATVAALTPRGPAESSWTKKSSHASSSPCVLGPCAARTRSRLIDRFGSARAVLRASPKARAAWLSPALAEALDARCERDASRGSASPTQPHSGSSRSTPARAGFPTLLASIPDPPLVLWTRGLAARRTGAGDGRARAALRTRALACARGFAAEIARAGIAVISGLAYGVDAAAHEGALDGRGRTVGGARVGTRPGHAARSARARRADPRRRRRVALGAPARTRARIRTTSPNAIA